MRLRSGYRLLGALGGRRVAAPSPPPDTRGEDLCLDLSNESGLDAVGSKADKDHDAVSEQVSTHLSVGGECTDGLSSLGGHDSSADDTMGSWAPSLDDLDGADPNDRDGMECPDLDDSSPRCLRHLDDFSADQDNLEWADLDDFSLDSICSADSAMSEACGFPSVSSFSEEYDEEYEEIYYMSALEYGSKLCQETSDVFNRWKRLQARKRVARRVPRSPRPSGSFDTTTGAEHVQEAWKKWVRVNAGGSIAHSYSAFVDGKIVL